MPRLLAAPPPRAVVRVEERPPFWWLRWVPAFLFGAIILYVLYLLGRVAIVPVLASFGIAYVLNPIAEAIRVRGVSRAVAAILALTFVTIFAAVFIWFVVPDLWAEATEAGGKVMGAFTESNARAAREKLHEVSPMLDRLAGYRLYSFLRNPNSLVEASQSWFAGSLTDWLATASNMFDLLLVPFFVFYILVDFPHWRTGFEEFIPPRFHDPFSRLFDETGRILQSYVLGQLMIAIIMGVLYGIGFAIFQVPAWAGIAALSGFLNVVPYFGTGLGIILATGFTFAHGGDLWRIAGVFGVFVAVQSIEGYYLTPKILGGRLSLHPMAVFLGLLVGGRIFGFLGVLLAVPTIAVAQVFLKFAREIYKHSEFYRAGAIGPDPPPAQVEEVIAKAADTVLADQVQKQTGDEVLTPPVQDDDRAARQKQLV